MAKNSGICSFTLTSHYKKTASFQPFSKSFLRVFLLLSFLFFIFQVGFSQTQLSRTVNLRVAADEEFRSNKNWRLEIKRLVAASSKVFEESFGIRFEIKSFKSWISDNSQNSTFDLLNDLRRKIPQGECDAVVGFTSQFDLKYDLIGAASYLRAYVLLRKMKSDSLMIKMLTHELCHLFGAIDVDEKGSIMDKENPGQKFDAFTTQIILLNKYRNFNPYVFPLSKSKLDEVISICEQRKRLHREEAEMACHKAIALDPNLPEPHNILGILFDREERTKETLEAHRKAIRLKPDYLEAHLNLANVLFKRNILAESALHYKKVIEIDSTHAQAHNNLAVIFYHQKNYEKSWEHLKKAENLGLKAHPDFKKELLKKLKKGNVFLSPPCLLNVWQTQGAAAHQQP